MADTIVQRGYLDLPYLDSPYTGGEIDHHISMQVNMVINDQKILGMQTEMIAGGDPSEGMEASLLVNTSQELGMQIEAFTSVVNAEGMQAEIVLSNLMVRGMEAKIDTLRHNLCPVYLEGDYLSEAYLAECMNAYMGMQVEFVNRVEDATGAQAEMVLTDTAIEGMQAYLIINAALIHGMQIDQLINLTLGMQVTLVIYNTTQLRIMLEFPSRGTPALLGNNWTASSTASGDYLPKNVNTDIIEQAFRSAAASSGLVTLTCDTGLSQGVPVDTIAILGHNLTTSATVQVQGSQDNFATAPAISFDMLVEKNNMYYIAPALPTTAGQNRYWRFIIQDPTNPSGYVEIGTILFGASQMFSIDACFSQPITMGYKHFKDGIQSEGFTTKSNDRALKKFIKLKFDEISFRSSNYTMLDDMLQFARTSLKTLVIPTPEYSSRFAVYAKIAQMPELTFIDNGIDAGYVSLDLEWDESL